MANYRLRQLVTERAYGCCEYCMSQERFASQSFSLEHFFPKVLGGTDDLINQRIVYHAFGIHPPSHSLG